MLLLISSERNIILKCWNNCPSFDSIYLSATKLEEKDNLEGLYAQHSIAKSDGLF